MQGLLQTPHKDPLPYFPLFEKKSSPWEDLTLLRAKIMQLEKPHVCSNLCGSLKKKKKPKIFTTAYDTVMI